MKRFVILGALLGSLIPLACGDQNMSGPDPIEPSFLIEDAVHNNGNPHFYWLPPMVEVANPGGSFDPSASPVVEICELNGTECLIPLIAQFTMTTGPGSETIRLVEEDEQFILNWHTDEFGLDATTTYRISVLVSDQVLGIADVDVVNSGNELKRVDTGLYIPLKDGRTLPIKFRVEAGALLPDLTALDYCGPSSVYLGDRIDTDITLANTGAAPVTGIPWILHYYLSEDAAIDPSDFYLGGGLGLHNVVDLEPGETYGLTDGGTPAGIDPGVYHLLLKVDASELVGEYDESNNVVEYCSPLEVIDPFFRDLVAYYPLDGDANDYSGNSLNGVVQGGAIFAGDRFGVVGKALSFDGEDDLVTVAHDALLNVSGDYSFSAWVVSNTQAVDPNNTVLGKGQGFGVPTDPDGHEYALWTTNGQNMPRSSANDGYNRVGYDEVPLSWRCWTHLAFIVQDGQGSLYVNGQVVATGAINSPIPTANDLTIGGLGSSLFSGLIDEVYVFDRALSDPEVQELFDAPANICLPFVEDFQDGDYTFDPTWSLYTPGGGSRIVDATSQELRIKRYDAGGEGRWTRLETPMGYMVTDDTEIQFDVKVVHSSVANACGYDCREFPVEIVLHVTASDGSLHQIFYVYNNDGGYSQTFADGRYYIARGDAPTNEWLRGESSRIRDVVPNAVRITTLQIGGVGWDYEGWYDNIVISNDGP